MQGPSANTQCVEVAKVLRVPQDKAKGKAKAKEKPKTAPGKESNPLKPTYDYHEGSVYDVALRQDLLRGYERFKVCRRPWGPRGDND